MDAFYGTATDTMTQRMSTLGKQQLTDFTAIILGENADKFDTFVENWNKLGGETIVKRVNDWVVAFSKRSDRGEGVCPYSWRPMKRRKQSTLPLHLMLLPAVVFLSIYNYLPMIGNVMAFVLIPVRGFWLTMDRDGKPELRFHDARLPSVLWNTFFIANHEDGGRHPDRYFSPAVTRCAANATSVRCRQSSTFTF